MTSILALASTANPNGGAALLPLWTAMECYRHELRTVCHILRRGGVQRSGRQYRQQRQQQHRQPRPRTYSLAYTCPGNP
jgi:hypothetical protein